MSYSPKGIEYLESDSLKRILSYSMIMEIIREIEYEEKIEIIQIKERSVYVFIDASKEAYTCGKRRRLREGCLTMVN